MPDPYTLPPLPASPDVRAPVRDSIDQHFPLSGKEVEWLKQRISETQSAVHKGRPLTTTNPLIRVSTGPGSSVPTIHAAPGYVTTISVLDSQGNPWPITSYTAGGGKSFAVHAVVEGEGAVPSDKKGVPRNLLTVSPVSASSSTNLMLTLEGSVDPVLVMLSSNGPDDQSVDGMVSLRIDRPGPMTPPPVVMPPPPSSAQPELLLFLDQTPPKGATPIQIHSGFDLQMWSWNGQMVVRSTTPLLSPAWTDEVEQNHVRVYVIPKTQVLLLKTEQGPKQVPVE